jgi:hypothetical protein
LTIFYTVVGVDQIKYEGLRVDISALTLNRDILACIVPAMNRTLNNTFKSISEHEAFTSLYITDIKITKPTISEDLFDMDNFTFTPPIYELRGDHGCISFQLSFSYSMTFLGFKISSGSGTSVVNNEANKIYVFFNETHPDVQIPHPWDVTNIKVGWGLFTPKAWIERLLEKKFIDEFHKAVDVAMDDFAHKLLQTYERVEDIYKDSFDLVYFNVIMDVKSTVDKTYMSIGFDTNITVNGVKVRKMYRTQNEPVTPLGDFSYCLAAELLPDSLDALDKAGFNRMKLKPHQWGFENDTVSVLFEVIPGLTKKYMGIEALNIDCQISLSEPINDITYRGKEDLSLDMQYPLFCDFTSQDDSILKVDVYARLRYMMNDTEHAYGGYVSMAELYGFKVFPNLPSSKKDILHMYVKKFVKMFEGINLIAPGLKVTPNRAKDLNYTFTRITNSEICFGYDELKY